MSDGYRHCGRCRAFCIPAEHTCPGGEKFTYERLHEPEPTESSAMPDLSAVEVIAQALRRCAVYQPEDAAQIVAEALLSAGSVQYGVRHEDGRFAETGDEPWPYKLTDRETIVQRRLGLPVDEEWKNSQ